MIFLNRVLAQERRNIYEACMFISLFPSGISVKELKKLEALGLIKEEIYLFFLSQAPTNSSVINLDKNCENEEEKEILKYESFLWLEIKDKGKEMDDVRFLPNASLKKYVKIEDNLDYQLKYFKYLAELGYAILQKIKNEKLYSKEDVLECSAINSHGIWKRYTSQGSIQIVSENENHESLFLENEGNFKNCLRSKYIENNFQKNLNDAKVKDFEDLVDALSTLYVVIPTIFKIINGFFDPIHFMEIEESITHLLKFMNERHSEISLETKRKLTLLEIKTLLIELSHYLSYDDTDDQHHLHKSEEILHKLNQYLACKADVFNEEINYLLDIEYSYDEVYFKLFTSSARSDGLKVKLDKVIEKLEKSSVEENFEILLHKANLQKAKICTRHSSTYLKRPEDTHNLLDVVMKAKEKFLAEKRELLVIKAIYYEIELVKRICIREDSSPLLQNFEVEMLVNAKDVTINEIGLPLCRKIENTLYETKLKMLLEDINKRLSRNRSNKIVILSSCPILQLPSKYLTDSDSNDFLVSPYEYENKAIYNLFHKVVNFEFNILNKDTLLPHFNEGLGILHLRFYTTTNGVLVFEGFEGNAIPMTLAELLQLLKPLNTVNIDLLILETPNQPELIKRFKEMKIPNVVGFEFKNLTDYIYKTYADYYMATFTKTFYSKIARDVPTSQAFSQAKIEMMEQFITKFDIHMDQDSDERSQSSLSWEEKVKQAEEKMGIGAIASFSEYSGGNQGLFQTSIGGHPMMHFWRNDYTNIPRIKTPLIDRNNEIDEIFRLLKKEKNVVVIGPKGCGKTALALQFGNYISNTRDLVDDGVYYVPLKKLKDFETNKFNELMRHVLHQDFSLFLNKKKKVYLIIDDFDVFEGSPFEFHLNQFEYLKACQKISLLIFVTLKSKDKRGSKLKSLNDLDFNIPATTDAAASTTTITSSTGRKREKSGDKDTANKSENKTSGKGKGSAKNSEGDDKPRRKKILSEYISSIECKITLSNITDPKAQVKILVSHMDKPLLFKLAEKSNQAFQDLCKTLNAPSSILANTAKELLASLMSQKIRINGQPLKMFEDFIKYRNLDIYKFAHQGKKEKWTGPATPSLKPTKRVGQKKPVFRKTVSERKLSDKSSKIPNFLKSTSVMNDKSGDSDELPRSKHKASTVFTPTLKVKFEENNHEPEEENAAPEDDSNKKNGANLELIAENEEEAKEQAVENERNRRDSINVFVEFDDNDHDLDKTSYQKYFDSKKIKRLKTFQVRKTGTNSGSATTLTVLPNTDSKKGTDQEQFVMTENIDVHEGAPRVVEME